MPAFWGLVVACAGGIVAVAPVAAAPTESSESAEITQVADIMESTRDEDRGSLTVRGVITLKVGEGLVLQDDTAGIWIDVTQSRRLALLKTDIVAVLELREGDVVEVVGRTKRGGYAPRSSQ